MISCRICRKIFEWTEGMECTKCLGFYHRACLNVPSAAQLPSSSLMCLICETKAQKVENQSTPIRGTYEDYNVGKKQISPPGSSREDDLLGNAPCCDLAAELKLLRAEKQAMRGEFHELKEKIEFFAVSSGTYNTRIDVIEERMNAFDQQHVSLSLREDIKLNVTENAWKPARHKEENLSEEEQKSQIMNASPMNWFRRDERGLSKAVYNRRQKFSFFVDHRYIDNNKDMELYNKFRGILNKLTRFKFDTLMNQVKSLEINNQKRLEGITDLVFEKAIDEPIFSEAYAAMCNKLSMLKVPADNPTTPDQCVNFRALIINRCQKQFVTDKVDERVLMIEKEIAECSDPLKKKLLLLQLEEEKRRVRMRSVGNVRFIGELYKLKMLTSKIMIYCMNYLSENLDDEKLECLCVLLTTIGEQFESEAKEQLDRVFMRMQEIVYLKSNVISNRVRFMIQDVIELRKRRWVTKSVVDSQPKTMNQIQREQRQREIEIMNAARKYAFRRDEDGRGRRVYNRKQNSTFFMDNSKRPIGNSWRSVDTPKLSKESKDVMQKGASQSDQSSLSKADLVMKIKARLASVDSKKAQELGGVFLFNIIKGTSVYSWTLDLNKVVVYEGEPEEDPDTTFTLSEQIFKQLVQGREDPRVIMQAGRCSVTGDIMRAMKLEPYIKLD